MAQRLMRFLTSGESHGKGLSVFMDGLPAGLGIDEAFINNQLARRQQGYGRGGRMNIETDTIEILNGVRFGQTIGAPVTFWIQNRDFANWETVMASSGESGEAAEAKAFYHPRPGHADLAGYTKFGQPDLRNILERSSARETAARVAAGAVAKLFLKAFGIEIFSHVLVLGGVSVDEASLPGTYPEIEARAESNAFRCAGPDETLDAMKTRIDACWREGITLGGRIEVVATGVPVGLGNYAQWDQRLDGKLAQSLMSIQAVKAVSIGAGDEGDTRSGDLFHDPILREGNAITRPTNRAGGLEGGMTNGMPIVAHVVMKPISTMRKALPSVNLKTGEPEAAHFERSDVTAVPACGVVAEAMMAITLAEALLEKFGGDSMEEILAHFQATRALEAQRFSVLH